MEREILFRGKRIDNGEWVCGSLLVYPDGVCFICCSNKEDTDVLDKYLVSPETVEEYTGLTDKNGVKIFEGDIVCYQPSTLNSKYYEFNCLKGHKFVVKWKSTGFYVQGIQGELYGSWLIRIPHNKGHLFEVIGNIHDNPKYIK